jgi:hypothetical protein
LIQQLERLPEASRTEGRTVAELAVLVVPGGVHRITVEAVLDDDGRLGYAGQHQAGENQSHHSASIRMATLIDCPRIQGLSDSVTFRALQT